jgi:hypothetical protein
MTTWRREPILFFLIATVVVFVGDGLSPPTRGAMHPEIRITAADIARLEAHFFRMWQRFPSASDLDTLVEDAIRTEVLAHEAVAIGLDRDDALIRRQLRHRIEALAEDGARTPSDREPSEYFTAQRQTFRREPRHTFSQIYFNPDLHHRSLDRDLRALLKRLNGPAAPDVSVLGDRTLLERSIVGAETREIAAQFGSSFAESLARTPVGVWQADCRVAGSGVRRRAADVLLRACARDPDPALDRV